MDSSDPLANAVPAATDRDRPDRRTLANAIRILAMDAVQQANSGHPGMPMGMADIAEVLANDFMRCNPSNPGWPDRDRLVVSNGHGCMLQYALLHLTGYDLPLEQLRQFRQLHSRTPGHPEYRLTPGVETTTGPLGQGLANAVGMALAEATLAAEFNRDGENIVDHWTWCLAGDGCLMEGISHEACSLAGHLGLGKLVVFYDDNGISIDGEVAGWFSDDTAQRFEAYGWQVVPDIDGHNAEAIAQAIATAREDRQRRSFQRERRQPQRPPQRDRVVDGEDRHPGIGKVVLREDDPRGHLRDEARPGHHQVERQIRRQPAQKRCRRHAGPPRLAEGRRAEERPHLYVEVNGVHTHFGNECAQFGCWKISVGKIKKLEQNTSKTIDFHRPPPKFGKTPKCTKIPLKTL